MPAFPIAAAIGALGSIGSSLFAPKPKTISPKKQILSTVAGAREAGIHPLAALGSGAQYTQVGGGSSTGSAIGDGLQTLAANLANQKSREEIEALRADTRARNAQAELYRAQSRSLISRATGSAREKPALKIAGLSVSKNPGWSDAQDVQDRYGDLIENVYGLGVVAADTWHNNKGKVLWKTRPQQVDWDFGP